MPAGVWLTRCSEPNGTCAAENRCRKMPWLSPLPLPDHHAFDTLPWADDVADVLVTEKDAVKLAPDRIGDSRVWVVPLDFRLPDPLAAELLDNLRLLRRPA